MTIGRTENFTNPTVAKRTYTVAEVMDILGVSRKKAYELCNSGSFKIVHIAEAYGFLRPLLMHGWITNRLKWRNNRIWNL